MKKERGMKERLRLETLCLSLSVASLHQNFCGVMHLKNKN